MKKQVIDFLRGDIGIFLGFFALVLITRFPYFFQAVIDWDESTFILTGQSLLDGHLPYTELWDLKPPLIPFFFACFILIFGKHILSIRLAGSLCVLLVAWFTFLIGRATWSARVGLISGTFSILLISLFPSGQATMSEHIALVFVMGALALVINSSLTPRRLFGLGILMATASLVRLNLAYVSLIVGLAVTLTPLLNDRSSTPLLRLIGWRALVYTAGNLSIIAATALPYLLTGQIALWWESVVVAPLLYSSAQLTWTETVYRHIQTLGEMILKGEAILTPQPPSLSLSMISALVWLGGVIGVGIVGFRWQEMSHSQRRSNIFLLCFLVSTGLSIVMGGAAHPHYLIQLIPFATLYMAVGLDFFFSRMRKWQVNIAISWILIMALAPILPSYLYLQSRLAEGKDLNHGPAYEIVDYLEQSNPERDSIYMMIDHVVYWLINEKPLTRTTTHPSILGRRYLLELIVGGETTTARELSIVLDKQPKFIVTTDFVWYLEHDLAAKALLEKSLQNDYRLVNEIQGRQIYQIRDRRSGSNSTVSGSIGMTKKESILNPTLHQLSS